MTTKVRIQMKEQMGETGELRLGHVEFAGSVGMLGTCQTDSWHLRPGAWGRALAEEYKIEHYPLIGGS